MYDLVLSTIHFCHVHWIVGSYIKNSQSDPQVYDLVLSTIHFCHVHWIVGSYIKNSQSDPQVLQNPKYNVVSPFLPREKKVIVGSYIKTSQSNTGASKP